MHPEVSGFDSHYAARTLPDAADANHGLAIAPDLVVFRRRKSFNPENFTHGILPNPKRMPLGFWKFTIHEEILELGTPLHTEGAKSITRPPMPKSKPFIQTRAVKKRLGSTLW